MRSKPEACSRRIDSVQFPIIPAIAQKIRQTPGTISLGQGVVYYGPPQQALNRIAGFLENPDHHKYGAVQGLPELRAAIAEKLSRANRIDLARSEVVVTAGSNMGFYHTVLAIGDPGDEFIIADPYYFNHEMAIRMAGCRPVSVPVGGDYQLQPERIAAAVSPRTKAIVTISPNNPTGAVYSEENLRAINELCLRQGIYHISDEAYEYFIYGSKPHFSPASIPGASAHTISLFSLSKAYGFASWRVGYMVIPAGLLDAISKIQDTVLICPPVISQFAALGALDAGLGYFQSKFGQIEAMRSELLTRLAEMGDFVEAPVSEGAFYILLKVRTRIDDLTLVDRLIRRYRVAVIPGSAFGIRQGCYLRVAYGALDRHSAEAGAGRLVDGIRGLISAG
ncbi:MAG: pyridoxal phosphate-dependent aminotransferase [Methylococcaceae bacterium]|nr:pyridoxal phosphate-dependent aminotransferase [Methylococcaceae bacterium]